MYHSFYQNIFTFKMFSKQSSKILWSPKLFFPLFHFSYQNIFSCQDVFTEAINATLWSLRFHQRHPGIVNNFWNIEIPFWKFSLFCQRHALLWYFLVTYRVVQLFAKTCGHVYFIHSVPVNQEQIQMGMKTHERGRGSFIFFLPGSDSLFCHTMSTANWGVCQGRGRPPRRCML